MSRLPRHLEHLKTGFTAEAVSAALFRAFGRQAEVDGRPQLARRWRRLAEDKDALAIAMLAAAGRVGGDARNLQTVIGEEQYENEVLYPRLLADMESLGQAEEADVLRQVHEAHREHLRVLQELRREMTSSQGDVAATDQADLADQVVEG